MRIRYLKNTPQILADSCFIEQSPSANQGRWLEYFSEKSDCSIRRLCLEIGCGMGRFICQSAREQPETGWIGAERLSTILARAALRLEQDKEEPANLTLIRLEAAELAEVFAPGELDCIYLNFSDPWPKERHAKRRLTSERFLPLYSSLLKEGGILQMKTDNECLFEYSLQQLKAADWSVAAETRDLHASAFARHNIMTEYEERFVSQGKKICLLRAQPAKKLR